MERKPLDSLEVYLSGDRLSLRVPAEHWWAAPQRGAWAPPEDISVSQWAERHRVLPKQSAIPGPWSNSLVPYALEVMDSFNDPRVDRITIMANVQSSKTESVYNMLGWAISQDPAPALIVMPTLETLKRVNKRIRDMIWECPDLRMHLTGDPDDLKQKLIILDRMEIYFATAGSDADLQNVEARYVLKDETDIYPAGSEEDSPMEKADDRATTYWNRKIINLSRPTVPEGNINVEFLKSDQRKFWVPCPECGGYQMLSFWQVKCKGAVRGEWPQDKRNKDMIIQRRLARYECLYCEAEIEDKEKSGMLARGKWVPEGHQIERDGTMPPVPQVSHVGFWWSVLYSPFKSWSEVAAKFFEVKKDREKYRNFVTQWLAEPWKEVIEVKQESAILELRTNRPPLVVPAGALGLTAGVDNQKRGFWVSIWAWVLAESGVLDQHLIRYGFLHDEAELATWILQDVYWDDSAGLAYPVWRGGMDVGGGEGDEGGGSLTEQAYEWLRRSGKGKMFGVKGAGKALVGGKKMSMNIIDRMPGKGVPIPGGIRLWTLDTGALKDSFWARVSMGRVHLHAETGEDFASQLAAESKERDKRGREVWVQQGRRPNHLLDTAIYATAMADPECWGGVMVLPRPETEQQREEQQQRQPENPITGRPVGSWLER